MQSITAIAFLLATCVASTLAACQLEVGDIPESYVCEGIHDLQPLSVIPSTAQRITVFNSKLTSLPGKAFTRFGSTLVYLNISHSELAEISAGTFSGLTSLHDLVLDNNLITTINTNWIQDLENLKTLRIFHNHITKIEPGVFDHLPNLEFLDIAYNKIDYCISPEHLAKLTSLDFLYLTGNPWPLRCRPPVIFHLEDHHVQAVHTWGYSHILIAECLEHELHAKYNDAVLENCVEKLSADIHSSIPVSAHQ